MNGLPLLLACLLALVHLATGRVRALELGPRSWWLSMAGGAAVAYVFVFLLPHLSRWQRRFVDSGREHALIEYLDDHLYLVALIGVIFWYGLEHAARPTYRQHIDSAHPDAPPSGLFWVHVGSFALYNGLIGYLLTSERRDVLPLVLFSVAMGLHLLVNDFGLRRHHKDLYHDYGRWVLSGAVLAGAIAGRLWPIHPRVLGVIFAFLVGGIVLNVLKEELPEDRQSRFWAFAIGAAAYTTLLLLQE